MRKMIRASTRSGFEIRPSDAGLNASPNPKDVNNAIAQLTQAHLPFLVDLYSHRSLEGPGISWRYASANGRDDAYLVLITNAKLRYFTPPLKFGEISDDPGQEVALFREVPWVVFQPEHPPGLRYHQRKVVSLARASNELKPMKGGIRSPEMLEYLQNGAQEIHIINFDHLDKLVELVKNPPRIEKIELSITADGAPPVNVSIG